MASIGTIQYLSALCGQKGSALQILATTCKFISPVTVVDAVVYLSQLGLAFNISDTVVYAYGQSNNATNS